MRYLALVKNFVIGLMAAGAFAACGVTPGDRISSFDDTKVDVGYGKEVLEGQATNSPGPHTTYKYSNNSTCGEATLAYSAAIIDILEKYNRDFAKGLSANSGYPKAGHPDAPEPDGVSVMVCQDPRLAAYATNETVAIHEGLLWLLDRSAIAQALYSGNDLEKTLDQLTGIANDGGFDLTSARLSVSAGAFDATGSAAEELFLSALAFVIYHELGHNALGHNYNHDESRLDPWGVMEIQADNFAAAALSTAGYSTAGIDLVFDILGRVNPEGSIYHPPVDQRANMVEGLQHSRNHVYLSGK